MEIQPAAASAKSELVTYAYYVMILKYYPPTIYQYYPLQLYHAVRCGRTWLGVRGRPLAGLGPSDLGLQAVTLKL